MTAVYPNCEFQIFGQKKKGSFFRNTSKLFFDMLLIDVALLKNKRSN